MSQTPNRIVAVGYEVDFTNLKDLIEKECPSKISEWKVTSGVWYGPSCKNVQDAIKSSKELEDWFNSRKPKEDEEFDDRAFIVSLYIAKNERLIVGEVYRGTDSFYVFFYNERGVPTSLIKKEVNRGDSAYRVVKFKRMTITARPYIHMSIEGKNVLMYS